MTAEEKTRLDDAIWIDPERMSGTPCFRNTSVPVKQLMNYITGGSTIDEFLKDFSTVSRYQAIQFLELGHKQLVECLSSMHDEDPILALRGVGKDLWKELGGGEKFIREMRDNWYGKRSNPDSEAVPGTENGASGGTPPIAPAARR